MTRFAGALACLLATASAAHAMQIPASLRDVVKAETPRVPALHKKEQERKSMMQKQLQGMAVDPNTVDRRQLYNYNYNNNNGGNNNNQNQNQQNQYNNYQGDAAEYNWDEYADEYALGFDITSYSVKYTQCATVQSYSDDLAADEYSDTVLAAQRFALFRLCPVETCSDYSNNGCASNYGEYIVSLDQFLLAMLEYQESRVAGYCEYCQGCAAIEAAKNFWTQVYYTRDYALQNAQTSYTTWYTQFLESYNYQNQNGNGYNNANNAEGDGYEEAAAEDNQYYDSNMLAQRYYNTIRNGNNYANQYAQNNYAYSNQNSNQNANYANYNSNGQGYGYNAMSGQYRWTNQNMWNMQQAQQQQASNQASWQAMGSPSGTFYGKQIMNGYYDGDGAFNQIYGYFNSQGEYVSLEDDEIEWDEDLWGEMPELWDGVDVDTESCSYQYAGTCYNQYEACMQILEDQSYQEYQQYNQAQNGNYQQQQGQAENQRRATLKDFLECVEVDPQAAYVGNDYANYMYATQNGNYQYAQQNQYYDYDCNGNEYCEQQRQYKEAEYQYNQAKYENRRYFIGPHCGSNNKDISLAVYKDEYCSVIDEKSTVESVLGYTLVNDQLDLMPSECMRCMDDGTSTPWYEDEEVYALEPMCSMLYQFAGKCNKNLQAQEYAANQYQNNNANQYNNANNANNGQRALEEEGAEGEGEAEAEEEAAAEEEYQNDWALMYQSEQQAANEEAVCAFIESLASNTYDENGEVMVSSSNYWSNPAQELMAETRAMNKGLMAALIITAIAALAMSISACVLHGALARKNIPWKPRRSKGEDPTEMARQNSGITMGRSRSGPGNNPLL